MRGTGDERGSDKREMSERHPFSFSISSPGLMVDHEFGRGSTYLSQTALHRVVGRARMARKSRIEAPRAHSRSRAHDGTTPWSSCDDAQRRSFARERPSRLRRPDAPGQDRDDTLGRRAVISGARADTRGDISPRRDREGARAEAVASGTSSAPRCASRASRVEGRRGRARERRASPTDEVSTYLAAGGGGWAEARGKQASWSAPILDVKSFPWTNRWARK